MSKSVPKSSPASSEEARTWFVEHFSACADLDTRLIPDLHAGGPGEMKRVECPIAFGAKDLDALRQREPKNEFTLVIGADNLENIHRWRDFQRILCEYGVAVYPRKGFDIGAIKKQLQEESLASSSAHVLDYQNHNGMNNLNDHLRSAYKIDLLDAPLVEISSTEIREGFSEGKDMSEWLM